MTRKEFKKFGWEQTKQEWDVIIFALLLGSLISTWGGILTLITAAVAAVTSVVGVLLGGIFGALSAAGSSDMGIDYSGGTGYGMSSFSVFSTVFKMLSSFLLAIVIAAILCVVIMLMFEMTYYIIMKNPAIKPMVAIRSSIEMMKGHKKELLLLKLSFIGWGILCMVCLPALIWVAPYYKCTMIKWQHDLYEEADLPEIFAKAGMPLMTEPASETAKEQEAVNARFAQPGEQVARCAKCGAKLPKGAKFCGKCGSPQ